MVILKSINSFGILLLNLSINLDLISLTFPGSSFSLKDKIDISIKYLISNISNPRNEDIFPRDDIFLEHIESIRIDLGESEEDSDYSDKPYAEEEEAE